MATALEPIAIAILAKAPTPGFAKTRLQSVLGVDGAAALQARFIARTVDTAVAAGTGPVTVWAAPDERHPVFRAAAARTGVSLDRQPGGDLGERMHLAMSGASPVLVIGTDCPALTPDHLCQAADALRQRLDLVILPVEDGGYALIGARKAHRPLFTDMPWGTATVMAETRRRASDLGLCWAELEPSWDVDIPADLERLRREGLAHLLE